MSRSGWSLARLARLSGVAGAVALAVAMTAGCGGSGADAAGDVNPTTPRDLLVTRGDIRAAKPGTPARTVLSWWRAIQLGDTAKAATFYAPHLVSESELRTQLRAAGPPELQRPEIAQTVFNGRRAEVDAVLVAATFTDEGETDTITRRITGFYVVQRGREWLLGDNAFLSRRADIALARRKRSAEQSSTG